MTVDLGASVAIIRSGKVLLTKRADVEAWTVLATASNGSDTAYPYLLARRYGKGMIVLGGDDIRLSPARILENFVRYHEQTKRQENQP